MARPFYMRVSRRKSALIIRLQFFFYNAIADKRGHRGTAACSGMCVCVAQRTASPPPPLSAPPKRKRRAPSEEESESESEEEEEPEPPRKRHAGKAAPRERAPRREPEGRGQLDAGFANRFFFGAGIHFVAADPAGACRIPRTHASARCPVVGDGRGPPCFAASSCAASNSRARRFAWQPSAVPWRGARTPTPTRTAARRTAAPRAPAVARAGRDAGRPADHPLARGHLFGDLQFSPGSENSRVVIELRLKRTPRPPGRHHRRSEMGETNLTRHPCPRLRDGV